MKNFKGTIWSGITLLCAMSAILLAPAAGATIPETSASPATQPGSSESGGSQDSSQSGEEVDPGLTPDSSRVTPVRTVTRRKPGPVKAGVRPRRARFGSKVRISGRSGIKTRSRVRLFFRPNGGSGWHRLRTFKTAAKGHFSVRVRVRKSGRFRIEVKGNPDNAIKPVVVKSRLKVGSVKRFVNLGQKARVAGSVRPRGVRKVKIAVSGSGNRVIRTRTNARGKFKVKWSPGGSGNFRARVSVASNRIAKGDRSRRLRMVGLRPTHASYFGPGLYGGPLACGGSLSPSTRGVAHKTLPCGTKVILRHGGRTVTARVVDRGPYIAGREYDLTTATRNDLGFGDIGTVWTNR